MAEAEHVKLLRQGADTWNQWRRAHASIKPDLSYAPLARTNLSANLVGADLEWANLRGASLCRSNLAGANLCRANLSVADLSNAVLAESNLQKANLTGAVCQYANFRHSAFGWTVLGDLDLSSAMGLIEIEHHGPS